MKKRTISVLLVLCMVISLFTGISVSAFAENEDIDTDVSTAAETTATEESDVKSVFSSDLYVEANDAAGLEGTVNVDFDCTGSTGTLYLPGSADTSLLFFSWDDNTIEVSRDGIVYESGTAPVAEADGSVCYKVTKGLAVAYVTVKTMLGSEDVGGMFINIDEQLGTIDAMNSDEEHETSCYGDLALDGKDYYMSIKGRGNSTWGFDKKPYNLTFYKADDFNKKNSVKLINGGEKAKKWSLLANYFDNSLMRNKIAMDLANELGIGLDARFVDVWMNGEYLGNYLLTQKNDYDAPDGGYFIENDNYIEESDPQFEIPGMFEFHDVLDDSGYYNRITVKDIGDDAVEAGVDADDIEAYFNEAWSALIDYDTENYQNYFDMDSWAKMFLMYEVSKTYDCFSGSLLMHRDGLTADDKLIAGPAWDYDNAFGRTLHKFVIGMTEYNQLTAEGWYVDSIGQSVSGEHFSLLQELEKHESFMQHVAEIYNEYKWAFESLAENVDEQESVVKDSALMDNDKWGTNHICSCYYVTPMSLGTGKYALNYDLTVSWENYVNNLREFCTKRVLWLSDHLYAEVPEGSITQALNEKDAVVELKASLTAGTQSDTYQWQSSANGKKWTDIDGATKAVLKINAAEADGAMQYRCVVKNEGTDIYTVNGGSTKAVASTVLDPVTIDVTTGVNISVVALQEGKLVLLMDGEEIGEYTFAPSGSGWTICNESGKYIASDGKRITTSDTPFVWSYDNGVFSANVKVSYTFIGRWLGITHNKTVYLTDSDGILAVSGSSGSSANFLLREQYMILNDR